MMEPKLKAAVQQKIAELSSDRKQRLESIATAVQHFNPDEKIPVVFVCTHNSRRSQLAQAWFHVFSQELGLQRLVSLSAGTEDTAFHPNAIGALQQQGFTFKSVAEGENPKYGVHWPEHPPITMYSKTITEVLEAHPKCIAVMVCDHADANCPYIPEAVARIALPFLDPKEADHGHNTSGVYEERSIEIAAHMQELAKAISPGYSI